MQRDSINFREVTKLLINRGNVSFNAYDCSIRKSGFLVPVNYYHEDLVDIISFEEFLTTIEEVIPDIEKLYEGNYDIEKALYWDINATESYFQATIDLWFLTLDEALLVAEELEIDPDDIYDIENSCFINEDEDEE